MNNETVTHDKYKVSKVADEIMEKMQKESWTQKEAELLPEYLKQKIEKNSELHREIKPFIICKGREV